MKARSAEITQLLRAWGGGDRDALRRLAPLVERELHGIAHRQMQRQRPGATLQTTALVNEAYLHLVDVTRASWQDRAHFFAFCAQTMRRIVVDAARARGAEKRGAGAVKLSLDESIDIGAPRDRELIALDDALSALSEQDPRAASVVEMRFFGGLSVEETAEVMRLSPRTVAREWDVARSWLMRALSK